MPGQNEDQDRPDPQSRTDRKNADVAGQGADKPAPPSQEGVERVSIEEGPGAAPEGGTKPGDQGDQTDRRADKGQNR
jgi:hypothetical protein